MSQSKRFGLRHATPVFPNEPVEDRPPFGQPLQRAELISTHEAVWRSTSATKTATSFRLTSTGSDMHAPMPTYGDRCGPTAYQRQAKGSFRLRDGAEARPLRYPGDAHTLMNTVAPG